MNTKQLFIGVLTALLTLGFFGTAIASSSQISPHSSEGGVHEFSFDTPLSKADKAAMNHVYDRDLLSKVGTEAGNWEYRFDAPQTKADVAARNYNYNSEELSRVGTEAGNWEYRFDSGDMNRGGINCLNC